MKNWFPLWTAIVISGCGDLPDIQVTSVRSPAPAGEVMAIYMEIRNNTELPDTLISGSITGFSPLEIHESTEVNGMMTMRPVGPLEIPAGETVRLAPGGLHTMVSGFKTPPQPGEKMTLRLQFARAGAIEAALNVVTYAELEAP